MTHNPSTHDLNGKQPDDFRFDPILEPRYFSGVRSRRVLAWLVDLVIVTVLVALAAIIVTVLGLFTFGLGWLLFGVLGPGTALIYVGYTVGGPTSATVGMQLFGLTLRLWHGGTPDFAMGCVHAILFYVFNVLLTPLILLFSLFNPRKRTLHDVALGLVMVNTRALEAANSASSSAAPGAFRGHA